MAYEFLQINCEHNVAEIVLNRPNKANALGEGMWFELGQAFAWVDQTPQVRVAILRGQGAHFCAGIDFELVQSIGAKMAASGSGRAQESLRLYIRRLQAAFTEAERCRKPVLAAVHGSCYGAGIDLIAACDMRYAAAGAQFCVKELDLAIVADIGTLQRLPRIVGEGRARELAFSARVIDHAEAERIGLVNRCAPSHDELLAMVRAEAANIAKKSPLAVRGTKEILNYSRDHTIHQGLEYVATWNAGMLLSTDLTEAMEALRERRAPRYQD